MIVKQWLRVLSSRLWCRILRRQEVALAGSAMPAKAGTRRVLLVIAVLFVVGTVSVLATPRVRPVTDMVEYDALGLNLARGKGYTLSGEGPTAWRVPGYPLFLAAIYATVGHVTLVVRLLQVLIACASAWAAYRLAVSAFGDVRGSVWTAGLVALCPSTLLFAHLVLTEALFTGVFVAGLLAFYAWRQKGPAAYLVAGAVLGIATLIRPIAAFTVLALPLLLWRDRQRPSMIWRRTAAAWLGLVLVMSPWWYRNWQVFRMPIPTDLAAGVAFLIGNNEQAGGRSDFSLAAKLLPPLKDKMARDRIARQRALRFIRSHPLRFLRILPGKAAAFWGLDRHGIYCYREEFWGRPRRLGFLALAPTMLGIVLVLPLALASALLGAPRQPVRWMLWPLLTFWIAGTLSAPDARIHAPLVPVLAVLAGRFIGEGQWRFVLKPNALNRGVVAFWAATVVLTAYWTWEIAQGIRAVTGAAALGP